MEQERKYVVRRLTPGECARLQGFPDGWCDGIPHADSAEYKLWGNGMCLPVILYCCEGMVEELKKRKSEDMSWVDDLLN